MTTAASNEPGMGGRRVDGAHVKLADAGSASEALAAAAAIVLGILGLCGIFRGVLASVIAIVLGVAFLLESEAVGTRYYRLVRDVEHRGMERVLAAEIDGGLTADSVAGIAGIALGVISLLGVAATVLPAIALLAFGAALLLGAAASARLGATQLDDTGRVGPGRIASGARAVRASRVVLAAGAMVLAIIALVGLLPWMMTLVGYVVVATSLVLSGAGGSAALVSTIDQRAA